MSESGNRDLEAARVGRKLVQQLFVLHRVVGHYPAGHPAVTPPLDGLEAVLAEARGMGVSPRLALQDDFLFFGDQRLRPEAGTFEAFEHFMEQMRSWGIGAVVLEDGTRRADLEKTARLLDQPAGADRQAAFASLAASLEHEGVHGIALERLPESREGEDREKMLKERAKAIYSRTLNVVSDVMDEARVGKSLRLRKAKRVVQRLVDNLLEAEANLLGLTTIRCHDEYTFNHSVNVSILSIAVGQRVGLSRNALADLGMAALFHDIGKAGIPLEVLNKPTDFDEGEWTVIKRHPLLGVRELLRLKGTDVLGARIVVGAFEHHLRYDLSGYPPVTGYRGQSLLGRIICIADCYDAMTSSRVYDRTALAPEKALQLMLARSGEHFDPILLKVFVNTVGAYPVGTLCRLDTGELAVVVKCGNEPEKWDQPTVKIVADPSGNVIDEPPVDLSDPAKRRLIVGTLDARREGIDVTAYFL